jgi:hypothetical protein
MAGKDILFSIRSWLLRMLGLFFRLPVLFCLFFSWFYWGNPWYPASTISVKGIIGKIPSQIIVWWESGNGLNGYERYRFPLTSIPTQLQTGGIPLHITRTGEYHSASLGPKVFLSNIIIDGKKYLPPANSLSPGVINNNGTLMFQKDGATLQLNIKAKSSIVLEFEMFNAAGKVDVLLGDKTERYDLYSKNSESPWAKEYVWIVESWFVSPEGEFSVHMPMVRYPTRILRIDSKDQFSLTSVIVTTEDDMVYALSAPVPWKGGVNFSMNELNRQLKRYFHPDRFLLQIFFALFSSWLLAKLFVFATRFTCLKDIFFNEQRYIFWLMLFFGCFIFSFWHFSFWPGVMSNDSLKIWRAAQIPGMYLGDHPPLNVFFYMYLSMLWNNVAVVPVAQNLLTSLMTAYIFFSLYRKGLHLYFLLPYYALVVFSLPVGLYTIVLWKDIPFALLVAFLGFKLACFYFDKRNKTLTISRNDWISVILLTAALAGIRHNGVLYLFIVPFIVVVFGLVRIRPLILAIFSGLMVAAAVIFFILPAGQGPPGYLTTQTKIYLNQAMGRLSFDYLRKSGHNYLGVFDINQKKMRWDKLGDCMYSRYNFPFLKYLRWNDVYPYLRFPKNKLVKKMNEIAWSLYKKSYARPWVYVTWNPVYMLFLFPLLPLFFKKLPMTAVFSFYIIVPMSILVFLSIFNWRYYFFAYFASFFLLPMMVTDISAKRKKAEFIPALSVGFKC